MRLCPRGTREKILIQTTGLQRLQIDKEIQIESLRKLAIEFFQTN